MIMPPKVEDFPRSQLRDHRGICVTILKREPTSRALAAGTPISPPSSDDLEDFSRLPVPAGTNLVKRGSNAISLLR